MGAAKDYITAKQDAKIRADTTQYHLTCAYLAGISKLENDEGKIDFTKLEKPSTEQTVIDELYSTLIQYALEVSSSQATDEFTKHRTVQMVFGMTKKELAATIKTGKIQNYAEFFQSLNQNARVMGYFNEQWGKQYPIDQITYSDEARENVLERPPAPLPLEYQEFP